MKKIVPVIILMLAGTAGFAQTHNTVPGTPEYALDIIWDKLDTFYRYETFELNWGWGKTYVEETDYWRNPYAYYPVAEGLKEVQKNLHRYESFILVAKGEMKLDTNPIGIPDIVMMAGNMGVAGGMILLNWDEEIKTFEWFQYGEEAKGKGPGWSR
jgi:hypothetical protein